ncbi:uncharacterized protein LAESUDRAFT_183632 [Laetiporus sulphureus 93-53]|uniref:Uncharacterized protein n=1 Tax=Laetiporus sulphureus 93-53 TaxID=1314785 RepID=A0A165ARF0_9APHY|nr:uncharacterized protein LAESUDRAFT_183632 [Laetiporus sulphureus 93-53]KZS99516.1 hypothetical protein LAESUDRAFT_183632 [Laetiporus sulphureus 93-53]
MPAVASQALQLILRTVGPYTAVRYLNFAVGRGVGEPDEGETGDGMEAAVGLEEIAELVAEEASSVKGGRKQEGDLVQKMNELDVTDDCKIKIEEAPTSAASQESSCGHRETSMGIHKEAPLSILSDTDSEDAGIAAPSLVSALEPRLYYGAVSDKVGEAAACWLARWGVDVVQYELEVEESCGAGAEVGREQSVHVRWDAADAGRSAAGSRKRTATEPVRNGAGPSESAWKSQSASAREKERERARRWRSRETSRRRRGGIVYRCTCHSSHTGIRTSCGTAY